MKSAQGDRPVRIFGIFLKTEYMRQSSKFSLGIMYDWLMSKRVFAPHKMVY